MHESTARGRARGLTCGPHCVLRQWLNRLVCSCFIVKNMFMKVKTKSIISYIVDVMFLNVLEYKDHL